MSTEYPFPDKSPGLMEGFRPEPSPFKIVTLTAQQLWALVPPASPTQQQLYDAAADSGESSDSQYYGIEIEERSTFRQVVCFFDDDKTPVPMSGGRTLRRMFARVRFGMLTSAAYLTGNVSSWTSLTGAAVPLCPQKLIVRLWKRTPLYEHYDFPSYMELNQFGLTFNGAFPVTTVMTVYAPGVREIRAWGNNRNTAINAPMQALLEELFQERAPDQVPFTTVQASTSGALALATINIVAAADGEIGASAAATPPLGMSGYSFASASAGGAGLYTFNCGMRFNFYPGM